MYRLSWPEINALAHQALSCSFIFADDGEIIGEAYYEKPGVLAVNISPEVEERQVALNALRLLSTGYGLDS